MKVTEGDSVQMKVTEGDSGQMKVTEGDSGQMKVTDPDSGLCSSVQLTSFDSLFAAVLCLALCACDVTNKVRMSVWQK